MYKAIIFDFDYTLGDSTNGIVACVNYALETLGLKKQEEQAIRKTIGLTLKDTYKTLTSTEDDAEAEKFRTLFVRKADEVMVPNTVLYDGVKEILQKLRDKGYKIGIVTTKFGYRIRDIFTRFDALPLLDLIVGGDDVKVEKPSPEGLLYAIHNFGLSKSEVLYVGDSIVDAKTAENAGVDFAAVLTGTTTKADFCDYPSVCIGEKLSDVFDYIDLLGNGNYS